MVMASQLIFIFYCISSLKPPPVPTDVDSSQDMFGPIASNLSVSSFLSFVCMTYGHQRPTTLKPPTHLDSLLFNHVCQYLFHYSACRDRTHNLFAQALIDVDHSQLQDVFSIPPAAQHFNPQGLVGGQPCASIFHYSAHRNHSSFISNSQWNSKWPSAF